MNKNEVIKLWNEKLPSLEKAFVDFQWEKKEIYANYLAQTFRYISHSCELLKYASEKTTNKELKECLLHHVEEELGHENLALNDLKRMGYSLDDFPELDETRVVYNSIYNEIDECGAAPIIGYAMALEGLSARRCPEIAKRLEKKWGEKKSTLIMLHGKVDPGHIEESFSSLDFFTESELEIVANSIVSSIDRYKNYLQSVEASEQAAA